MTLSLFHSKTEAILKTVENGRKGVTKLGKYDDVVKHLGRLRGEDFVKWIYPNLEISKENIFFDNREFERINTSRRVDLLYRVKKENGEEFYFLLEFETGSYTDYHFRFLEYFTFVWRGVNLPIKPVVVFLNSTKTIQENPCKIECKIEEEVICTFQYSKIILPEENWRTVLARKLLALLPLIPISKIPEEEREEALKKTIEEIEKIEDKQQRAEIAGAFYILGGYKYEEPIKRMIGDKLMEELMQSGTYKEIFEKGEEKGEERAEKRSILKFLRTKFKKEFPQIEEKLNLIMELAELDFLVEKTAIVNSIEEFESALNELIKKKKK